MLGSVSTSGDVTTYLLSFQMGLIAVYESPGNDPFQGV